MGTRPRYIGKIAENVYAVSRFCPRVLPELYFSVKDGSGQMVERLLRKGGACNVRKI
jgi:hypothetical protein